MQTLRRPAVGPGRGGREGVDGCVDRGLAVVFYVYRWSTGPREQVYPEKAASSLEKDFSRTVRIQEKTLDYVL